MANEITFGYRTGAVLKYGIYKPDGTQVTPPTTNLPEILATGYYTASNVLISAGDVVIVLEGGVTVAYGEYQPEIIVANPDDCKADVSALSTQASVDAIDGVVDTILIDTDELQTNQGNWLTAVGFSTHSAADAAAAVWDEDITIHNIVDSAGELIQSLVQVFAGLPLPSISIDTIKTILQFTDTTYDDQLTLLIPIIEDVVVQYCGVSAISDLSVGAIFPIAGLCRYALENPIGAKSQTVGSDKTEYGEFPNALLKLLDNFKPDISGGFANAEVINLNNINEDLGI